MSDVLWSGGRLSWKPPFFTTGQASGHLGRVFEDVLQRVVGWGVEDGVHDLWRRTKFYSRILGDRDYSLLEVLHFGLRLPGAITSLGDVVSASVSTGPR